MKRINNIILVTMLFSFGSITSVYPQNTASFISENDKLVMIKKTMSLLYENYIFPEKVSKIENAILKKYNNQSYDSVKGLPEFIAALNNDLEKESQDKHVNIFFGPDRVKQIIHEKKNQGKTVPLTKEWKDRLKYENYRLRKVEWLEGNIGYFRFLNFTDLQVAKESIIGAMNFIRNSNGLIIDLRDNGGGSSETLTFILSYFLKNGLKIGEFHYRKNNRVEEIKIPANPAIKKIPDSIPLYILVSNKTASAAEGMASVLQGFKRAVILGEKTKGEGNPGELFVVNEQLYMLIPTAVSISAVPGSKTIQGVGVIPDTVIASERSFDKAMLEICRKLSQNTNDKAIKQIYEWQMPLWEYHISPAPIPAGMETNITGNFQDGRHLIVDNGNYFYVNKDNQKIRLFYYGNNIFGMEGKPFTRLRVPDNKQAIRFFEFFWDDGFVEKIPRTN